MDTALAEHAAQESAVQRILVVDDSRAQRMVLATSLRRLGYDVVEAGSGQEALRLCARLEPDLVFSDWLMPGVDGIEFCREFRRLPRDSYGYFILLTSKNAKEDIAKGLDAGADDFLTKPVDLGEVRARISAADRLLRMQRELEQKNLVISETLRQMRVLHAELDRDLQQAKAFQMSLLRDRHHDFGAAELSLILRSSGAVGGDLVGMFQVLEDHVGFFGIDVSGHGISSALMAARLAGYLSSRSPEHNIAFRKTAEGTYVPRCPADTVAQLNTRVLTEMKTDHYFTLLLATCNLTTGRLTCTQAGHPHPLLLRGDGRVEWLGHGGLPVGLIDGASYDQFEVVLQPGDRVLVLSDGVTEQHDRRGQPIGEQKLAQMVARLGDVRGSDFLDRLVRDLERCAGTEVFEDDVSAILFDFNGDRR